MDLESFSSGNPWAIRPAALDFMAGLLLAKESELKAAEDAFRRPAASSTRNDSGKVAVIPVTGPIAKRLTFLSALFGATVIDELQKVFQAALNDSKIKAIVLDVDSPGGTVNGIDAMCEEILAARKIKPVVAFANSQMCSAAYWIGSAASVVICERTASLGSIGVYTVHYDFSGRDEKAGLRRTVIASGKYKTVGHDAAPLSNRDRDVIQDRLDTYYSLFVDGVARNRGVQASRVRSKMADGRVFIGEQAVKAGLADQTGYLSDAIALASKLADNPKKVIATSGKTSMANNKGASHNVSTIKAKEGKMNDKDFLTLVEEHALRFKCTKADAIAAVMKKHPEEHRAYLEAANEDKC